MTGWNMRPVLLKFGIGDRVLFSRNLPLQVRTLSLGESAAAVDAPGPTTETSMPGSQDFFH